MSKLNTLTIAIIHWRNKENVEKLLGLLNPETKQLEIIVVNNSPEISLQKLKNRYPSVQWIENAYNRGFSFACNQATSQAKGEWLFFLNPDVQATLEEILQLQKQAIKKNWVALSPKPQSRNYWKPLPSLLSIIQEFTPFGRLIPSWVFSEKTLTGGALLIQTEVLKKLGGWDERFFLWFEDSDLTQRLTNARLRYGWSDVSLSHHGGQSVKFLSEKIQLHIFFHSLQAYAKKYFSQLSQRIIQTITRHYDYHYLLPQINERTTSIVVPNLSQELLFHFLKNNYHSIVHTTTELIVVTTQLPSVQFWKIKKEYPEARIINLKDNNGFAETTNIGFQVCTGSTIGTINDDVIIDKKSIEKLISQKNPGSLNPKIVNEGNGVESIGIRIQDNGKAQPILTASESKQFTVDATNAACVFYDAKALEKVGIFDEHFGSYLEDLDLSIRLEEAGYKNVVDPSISILHLKHQTSQSFTVMKAWNDMKNWWLLLFKHPSYFQVQNNFFSIFLERGRNFWGLLKSISSQPKVLIKPIIVLGIITLFLWLRFYNIEKSLLFFNDIGRDFLTLLRWQESGKPPLLGPQTSALPYNQSAIYFYILYPLFVLSNHSPFSTIYTNALFYVFFFLLGLFVTRRSKAMQNSIIFIAFCIAVHPQFIYQQRFVWNPSFVAPFIIAGTFLLIRLTQQFSFTKVFLLALSFAFASAFSYSATPTLISAFLIVLFLYPRKFLSTCFSFGFSLILVNLPTIFFEIRHHFLLTSLLFYGEKLPQFQTSLYAKSIDLLRFSLLQSTEVNIAIILVLIGITSFLILQKKATRILSPFSVTAALFVLNFAILAMTPVSIQAHYVFPFLTSLIIIVSLFPTKMRAILAIIVLLFFLQPNYLYQYFARAYRTVDETDSCAKYICSLENEPLFVSVQSDLHPYHNGMEFKYLFAENGCNVKELDTQIEEADTMAVVVDHSQYEHGKTSYNELTQFGQSAQTRMYTCQDNLKVVFLERN